MILALIVCTGIMCQPHELELPAKPSWFVGSEQDWCRATRDAWQELNLRYEVQGFECHANVIGGPIALLPE